MGEVGDWGGVGQGGKWIGTEDREADFAGRSGGVTEGAGTVVGAAVGVGLAVKT